MWVKRTVVVCLLFFATSALAVTLVLVLDPNESATLYVWHYPTRNPQLINPYAKSIYARHMGAQFDNNFPYISAAERLSKTGTDISLMGATQPTITNRTPSFASGDGKQFGYYVDTKELEEQGLFPFSVNYCKAVGLGAPQLTMEKNLTNQNLFPWAAANQKLEMSVEVQVPLSDLRVRKTSGNYVSKSIAEPGENVPIFISSSFLYLLDTKNNKLIAILFNYYDPRGAFPPAVGNDNIVYFYSTPVASVDTQGNSLTHLFTVEEGQMQRDPFKGYRNFRISINQQQFMNLIRQFGAATSLSTNPADYKLQTTGMLNEMNYLYKQPSSACVPDYDPQTFAKVGMSFKNFSVTVADNDSLAPYDMRGYYDGVYQDLDNKFYVLGWACATARRQPAQVDIGVGGNYFSHILATDASENAVNQICQESLGAHRFGYRLLAKDFTSYAGQNIDVQVAGPDGGKKMQLTPWTPWPTKIPVFMSGLDGLDGNGLLRGWTCAVNHGKPLLVSIYIDNEKVGATTADVVGETAIQGLCKASSQHRLEFTLSNAQRQMYRGKTISARVEVDGENVHELVKFAGINYTVY